MKCVGTMAIVAPSLTEPFIICFKVVMLCCAVQYNYSRRENGSELNCCGWNCIMRSCAILSPLHKLDCVSIGVTHNNNKKKSRETLFADLIETRELSARCCVCSGKWGFGKYLTSDISHLVSIEKNVMNST